MSRCVIIAAHITSPVRGIVNLRDDDLVICADGGYAFAKREGILPAIVIGDFDSLPGGVPTGVKTLTVPVEKDDTDLMLCLKYGIEHGCDEFVLAGALGGRLDHTLAALQVAAYGCAQDCFVLLADENNLATVMGPGTARVPRMEGYKLSVLAYTQRCTGVCESGVKWPLDHIVMSSDTPLGISNEFTAECAEISCETGQLLILLSRDA